MKKFWKAILIIFIIGIVLVAIGAIIVATNKEKFGDYFREEYEEKQYVDERKITSMSLEIGSDAVEIFPSTDGKLSVIYYESETNKYEFGYEDGTIIIKNRTDFKLKNIFKWGIGIDRPSAKIYLPETVTDKVDIEISSGALNSEKMSFHLKEFNIKVASGAVRFNNVFATTANIKVNSGAVHSGNIHCAEITTQLNSGALNFDNLSFDNASFKVSSGAFKAENVGIGNSAKVNVSSGTFKLFTDNDIADFTISGTANSGSFKLKEGDSQIAGGDDVNYGNGDKKITVEVSSGNATVGFTNGVED